MGGPMTRDTSELTRRRSGFVALGLVAALLLPGPVGAADRRPRRVELPDGFRPEGIETRGKAGFFVGSTATGAIYRGNLKTGTGSVLVGPREGRSAIGLGLRYGLLFVAGGSTGQAYVFDASTGTEVDGFQLTTDESFINDVDVSPRAAWFTDSFNQVLYKIPVDEETRTIGEAETIPLTGEIQYQEGFNVNGIASTLSGEALVIVQSNTGKLFKVDASSGETSEIDLGSDSVPNGDGILLDGADRLWVLQNQQKLLTRIHVPPQLASGTIEKRQEISGTDVPTTLARSGNYLALVNARFGNESPDTAEYWVTQLFRRRPKED